MHTGAQRDNSYAGIIYIVSPRFIIQRTLTVFCSVKCKNTIIIIIIIIIIIVIKLTITFRT